MADVHTIEEEVTTVEQKTVLTLDDREVVELRALLQNYSRNRASYAMPYGTLEALYEQLMGIDCG